MISKINEFVAGLIGNPTVVTNIYILIAITIIFAIYESWWRRWFGGGDFIPKWLSWLDKRFIKHCINILALFSICYFVRGLTFCWSLYATLILQLLFWTITFGMYFDIGRGGKPVTEYDIEEYNKSWFAPLLNWIFPEEKRYTDYYDYVGMFIRFTGPLLLLFFVPTFNSGLIFLGSIVSMAYGLGWVMYGKWLLKKIGPTEFGEYVAGFFTGIYWVVSI